MSNDLQFIEKAIDLKPGEELQEFIGDVVKAVRKLSMDREQDEGPVMLHGIFADHVILRTFGMGRNGGFLKCTFERKKDGVQLGNLTPVRMSFAPVNKDAGGDLGDHTQTPDGDEAASEAILSLLE